jgi:glycosyltransferase involved in cell wall biosynthesis
MYKSIDKKICIVVPSLGEGGAERSSAFLSQILHELGYEIHIISVLDKIDYHFKGKLFNLGELKTKDNTQIGRLKRLIIFRNYIKKHNFDYIIDNRTRIGFFKEFMLSKFIYKADRTLYVVRSFKTENYINRHTVLAKWLYGSAYRVVCVSSAISDKLKRRYNFTNLEVVYNPVDIRAKDSTAVTQDENYILYFGRLNDRVKNLSLLLLAYSESNLSKSNINLILLGEGPDKRSLELQAIDLKIADKVKFLDYEANPNSQISNALFTVLTSRYEGLPRSLIESLSLGVPVISVDCKSGPKEIIINEHNGLLVKNHDVKALTNAMNRMLEDEELYLHCKSNAKASISKFSTKNVGIAWQNILI